MNQRKTLLYYIAEIERTKKASKQVIKPEETVALNFSNNITLGPSPKSIIRPSL